MKREASGARHDDGGGTVGVVGAGQLARMLCEKASELGIGTVVLAAHDNDPAVGTASSVIVGTPDQAHAMAALAASCDVVTFDHEQVDLDILRELIATGHLIRPGIETLEVAIDKSTMRQRLSDLGYPVPTFAVIGEGRGLTEITSAIDEVATHCGFPLVIKPARGGYDGRGVFVCATQTDAIELAITLSAQGSVVVEASIPIELELAVIVARSNAGDVAVYPAVATAQVDGMCREVLVPGNLDPALAQRARSMAAAIAADLSTEGVLAVEFFVHGGALTVCEVAARPHNSGHWTIEGALCSQFENHLRAVLDLPLGQTTLTAPAVAMVNVIGGPTNHRSLANALAVHGAHIHDYAKAHRAGRKLGHVTVVGEDAQTVRRAAWQAARALGTEHDPMEDQ